MNLERLTIPKGFFRHFARNLSRLPLHFYAASTYFLSVLSTFHLFECSEAAPICLRARKSTGAYAAPEIELGIRSTVICPTMIYGKGLPPLGWSITMRFR